MSQARPSLQGLAVTPAGEQALCDALEQAFDYRGDVTITCADGRRITGYVFDRQRGPSLATSRVRIIPADRNEKLSIAYSEIAALEFTGRDMAAGKSWEAWVAKYLEKKAAGEANIELRPEQLD
jgi:hypothetical protein